eukprot:TRINITY_DN12687_c0_g1_i2.p1 TRINITY_DN12687_c0_g1~~TRINITY_DN12687_c0_g1_i2.p1  ORF type:complete len:431 (-),score=79.84 TRINITY_DN12687_c0_g1_i2:49-1341(-)
MGFKTAVSNWWKHFDADRTFSYRTKKVVKVLDRRAGFVYAGAVLLVVAYIVGYVFLYERGYLVTEVARGLVSTKTKGTAIGKKVGGGDDLFFDSSDLVNPPDDAGGVFIATRLEITNDQHRGVCDMSPEVLCRTDDDCKVYLPDTDIPLFHTNPICNKNTHLCQVEQWCPAESDGPFPTNFTDAYNMEGVDDFTIWFRSSINFDSLSDHFFSTIDKGKPKYGYDLLRLGNMIHSAGLTYTQVVNNGMIMRVHVDWDCDLTEGANKDSCTTKFHVTRLDDNYNMRYSHYQDNGATRDVYKAYGVRILLESTGKGTKISIVAIILQLSSGLALLAIAELLADVIILYFLPERAHYRKYKEKVTEDFSDLRDFKLLEDDHPLAAREKEKKKRQSRPWFARRSTASIPIEEGEMMPLTGTDSASVPSTPKAPMR